MELFSSALSAASFGSGIYTNFQNRGEAATNRAFQFEMASNPHQRQVADLRAAGLNPILSGTGGSGSPAAPGAMGISTDPLTPAINTGLAANRQKEEIENMNEQNKLIKSQAGQADALTNKTDAETAIIKANLPAAQTQAEFWIQALKAAKGLSDHVINPLITKLSQPGFGAAASKRISDAVQAAKSLLRNPFRDTFKPHQKKETPQPTWTPFKG